VFFYILLVAMLNLGLGFALAYYLGQRHSMRVGGLGGRCTQATYDAPAGSSAIAGQLNSGPSPEPTGERSPSEKSIDDLRSLVLDHHEQVRRIDEELRSSSASAETAEIASCLSLLKAANEDYLRHRDQAHQAFDKLHESEEEFEQVRDVLQAAIQRQGEQIEEAQEGADSFDYEGDLDEGCRQMIDRVGKLADAGYSLLDKLTAARIEVVRSQQTLAWDDMVLEKDPLTGILDRMGLEANLQQWWEKDPQHTRHLSIAMLGIDQFAKLNRSHGYLAGDRVLCALAQLMTTERRDNDTLTRFGGGKFTFVFPDKDAPYATSIVEQIRQTIEMIHFEWQESDIQVTVSCAVTAALAEDTPEAILARAEETLAEATRCGGNRTHLHDGQNSAPIVSPNLTMSEKTIAL